MSKRQILEETISRLEESRKVLDHAFNRLRDQLGEEHKWTERVNEVWATCDNAMAFFEGQRHA